MVRKSRKGREEWKIFKNVFDSFTNRVIFDLSNQGYFVELTQPVALGKEANVFLASREDGSLVAVKIYRLENCNFNKMYSYIRSDPRFVGLENQKRKVVFSWVQREYRNLLVARSKVRVPSPIVFRDNVIVMDFIGGDGVPSPMLKDSFPVDAMAFFDKVIEGVIGLLEVGLVHGDLSDFNILNFEENPVFIDFSQATVLNDRDSEELLRRDLKNVFRAFRSLSIDEDVVVKRVIDKFLVEKNKK
ncbi:serine protein kinase RIO [Candidatus Woesearchaeota archaeon]|nr:serine protein kinase RIO [Candidatus Woesearchaeota archaeon]